jgi:hypothetical protein
MGTTLIPSTFHALRTERIRVGGKRAAARPCEQNRGVARTVSPTAGCVSRRWNGSNVQQNRLAYKRERQMSTIGVGFRPSIRVHLVKSPQSGWQRDRPSVVVHVKVQVQVQVREGLVRSTVPCLFPDIAVLLTH